MKRLDMPIEEILERLRDDEQYYGDFGKNFLSNSQIQHLNGDIKKFGSGLDPSPNLMQGGLFHQLILEPEKAVEVPIAPTCSTRNTKIYKDFIEESGLEIALLQSEEAVVKDAVSEMLGNLDFYDEIRAEGNEYEVPMIKSIGGLIWKGKADILTDTKIIDLKTTSNIDKFQWSARNYNYDSQCYIYQELFGLPLVFFVVEKESNRLGMYEPTDSFIIRGQEKVFEAIKNYKRFFGENPTEDVDTWYVKEDLY